MSSWNLIAQTSSGFHVANVFHIASSGGWDYIAVGPDNNRLYVSHGTQVNVLDATTGDSIGVIPNTTGYTESRLCRRLVKDIPVTEDLIILRSSI